MLMHWPDQAASRCAWDPAPAIALNGMLLEIQTEACIAQEASGAQTGRRLRNLQIIKFSSGQPIDVVGLECSALPKDGARLTSLTSGELTLMNASEYQNEISTILAALRVKESQEDSTAPGAVLYAAHYTKLLTPKFMLEKPDTNKMRQFDGDYMNDPEEGRYLVEVMIAVAESCSHPLKSEFVSRLVALRDAPLLYSAYGRATFLSCWTRVEIKAGTESDKDSLDHWRFYGDDGKGSCIMVPMDHLRTIFPDQLYEVTYGSDPRGGGRAAANRPVSQFRRALEELLKDLPKGKSRAMEQLEEVIKATHPLLFLFKSSHYAAEKEIRTIVHTDSYASADKVFFDTREPSRAYIESRKGVINGDSILFYGPKASPHCAIEALGLAHNCSIRLKAFSSTKPYR